VHNPAIQGFCGGGEEAFALSAAIRERWTSFARSGTPGGWPQWDTDRRPTTVLGPWPGRDGLSNTVERPRDEELEILGAVVAPRIAG
jgi:carboxylesterase type B